jgi:hypothetical protein
VIGSVEKKICQNLPVRAGKPIDNQTFRDIDSDVYRGSLQHRTEAGHDLAGGFTQAELATLSVRSTDGNLLEGLDQLAGPVQICNRLTSCIATGAYEFLKLRTLQWRLGSQFGVERVGATRNSKQQ